MQATRQSANGSIRRSHFRLMPVFVILVLLGGCAQLSPQEPKDVQQQTDAGVVRDLQRDVTLAERTNQTLRAENKTLIEERDAQRRQLAAFQLSMLAKQSELSRTQQQIKSLQRQLNDNVLELARTKGKVRNLNSRAEAAASLAEAEIILKSTRTKINNKPDERLDRADQLIRMGGSEFNEDNFGGAIYLVEEARILIDAVNAHQITSLSDPVPSAGEVEFVTPVAFKAITKSNVRDTPSLSGAVVYKLDEGQEVDAIGYVGTWVHIKLNDDAGTGWIYYELITPR
jgi:hypothetical protein